MNAADSAQIALHRFRLVQEMEPKYVVDYLISHNGIFNDRHASEILEERDTDEKNRKLLEILKRRGAKALSSFVDALKATNQYSLADLFEISGAASGTAIVGEDEVLTLKKYYKEQFKSHNPLYLFLDFKFDMEHSYVSLSLQSKGSNEDTSDLDVFIEKAFSEFRLAIVIGDPFSGKTTLLQKIAFDWANSERFNQYDVILFSEFRSLPDGDYKSILDVGQAGVCKIELTNISKKRVLILIDGYDEKRHNQICNQLDILLNNNNEVNLDFDVLLTSRPSTIFNREQEASFWKINGFMNDEQQNDYIEKHFRNMNPEKKSSFSLSEKISAIKCDLEQNNSMCELANSPMMLTFFCLVHDKMKQITKPALFDAVVKFKIQRFDKKDPDKKILHRLAENGFDAKLTESQAAVAVEQWREFPGMRKLGKLAFYATLQKKFVFESSDFGTGDSAINLQVAFEGIGLLFKTSEVNGVSLSCKFQFVHRAMQEFFSALYFLYWQNNIIQHVETLLDRKEFTDNKTTIKFDHRYFVQMTFDVLMAERKEAALISISPLLSQIKHLYSWPSIHLQSQSVDELRKEDAFFQSVMRNCKKITSIIINGMRAAVDFAWTIKLPHDHFGGKIRVGLTNFNFVGTNELMLSVNCFEHVQLEVFNLFMCQFEPERLRLTVDGYLSHLKRVHIELTPEMMERLSILPDSRFTPSQWSGELSLVFPEENEDRAIYRLLQIFSWITTLCLEPNYEQSSYRTKFPTFSYFNLSFPKLSSIDHKFHVKKIHFNDFNKLVNNNFKHAPNLRTVEINITTESIEEQCKELLRTSGNFKDTYKVNFQESNVSLICNIKNFEEYVEDEDFEDSEDFEDDFEDFEDKKAERLLAFDGCSDNDNPQWQEGWT